MDVKLGLSHYGKIQLENGVLRRIFRLKKEESNRRFEKTAQ
jgi:hypothetical protein